MENDAKPTSLMPYGGEQRLSRYSNFINRHYRRYLAERLPALGLTASNYDIVLFLWHHLDSMPDGASQTQLSENIMKDKAAVARAVVQLQDLGYVRVSADPANRSRNIVSLTEEGKRAGKKINGWAYGWEETAIASLSESEQEAFIGAFHKVFLDLRQRSRGSQ